MSNLTEHHRAHYTFYAHLFCTKIARMPMKFNVIPAPEPLRRDVECFRVSEYNGVKGLAVKVAPKALPGIVFQHCNGRSTLENIVTPSHVAHTPTLFLYGAGTQPSTMNYR